MEETDKEKRQHTVSLPRPMFAILKAEAKARGLTVGEFNRSIVRCWIEQQPGPPRFARGERDPEQKQEAAVAPLRAVATTPAEVRLRFPPAENNITPAPVVPLRLADPDFDAPETVAKAREMLASRHDTDDVPF